MTRINKRKSARAAKNSIIDVINRFRETGELINIFIDPKTSETYTGTMAYSGDLIYQDGEGLSLWFDWAISDKSCKADDLAGDFVKMNHAQIIDALREQLSPGGHEKRVPFGYLPPRLRGKLKRSELWKKLLAIDARGEASPCETDHPEAETCWTLCQAIATNAPLTKLAERLLANLLDGEDISAVKRDWDTRNQIYTRELNRDQIGLTTGLSDRLQTAIQKILDTISSSAAPNSIYINNKTGEIAIGANADYTWDGNWYMIIGAWEIEAEFGQLPEEFKADTEKAARKICADLTDRGLKHVNGMIQLFHQDSALKRATL